ncbi:hypothetical protein PRK78_006949 [Emydomyces testavorans]|uniref:Uncharacterized protein n=1 Tax=Emydomyces testavorans TaxID=2070801 RepID=A0AAF0DNC9_9EURO|nr:hypothetical protein PRK78_006949 [Emydomyces testavorans]
MRGFFYQCCPLCQSNVDIDQEGSYCILPLDPTHANLLFINNWRSRNGIIYKGEKSFTQCFETYPTKDYLSRSLLFHRRCYELVKELSCAQLYLLHDLVEPTFFPKSLPPPSKHGRFSARDVFFPPRPWTRALFERLPFEIQSMVFEYNVGRLLFVMKTASQIMTRRLALECIPKERFIREEVIVRGDKIQVHLIDIGGRIYVSRLSEATDSVYEPRKFVLAFLPLVFTLHTIILPYWIFVYAQQHISAWIPWWLVILTGSTLLPFAAFATLHIRQPRDNRKESRCYKLDGCDYLAVQTDELGVVDIAFRATDAGPEWLLDSRIESAKRRVSVIRCANVHHLWIMRDVLMPLPLPIRNLLTLHSHLSVAQSFQLIGLEQSPTFRHGNLPP